ncbi:hypothetical protein SAMN05660862_1011 [Sphingobacterium psychroaquaticum]|uniref:Uncharacterized protein n=1 Tax=Sphingobacterium psychroaquaticum TaxID=561061 RepID=A0A1X7ILZ2_9SPHI|nr:hypothetical protein SAMN05660862_1011 [Sphingobacterium psychroaquaticum]
MKRNIMPLKKIRQKNEIKDNQRSHGSIRKRIRQRVKKAITEWEDMDESLQRFLK